MCADGLMTLEVPNTEILNLYYFCISEMYQVYYKKLKIPLPPIIPFCLILPPLNQNPERNPASPQFFNFHYRVIHQYTLCFSKFMQIICRGSKLWQLSACSVIAFLKYIQVFTSS